MTPFDRESRRMPDQKTLPLDLRLETRLVHEGTLRAAELLDLDPAGSGRMGKLLQGCSG
jgi:hypothetical protein